MSDTSYPIAPNTNSTTSPLDLTELNERFEGDDEFIQEMLYLFLDESPPLVTGIQHAIKAKDAEKLAFQAHGLKGASANIGAFQVKALAAALDEKGQQKDLTDAEQLLEQLQGAMVQLRQFIEGNWQRANSP